MQVCFRLQGQASYRAPASVRCSAAFDDASSKRKVLTLRGRTGFVTAMVPLANERDETVAEAISSYVDPRCLDQVQHVFSDDPSHNMLLQLRGAFKNIKSLCLDTTHLPIVYEYATWRRCAGMKTQYLSVRGDMCIRSDEFRHHFFLALRLLPGGKCKCSQT